MHPGQRRSNLAPMCKIVSVSTHICVHINKKMTGPAHMSTQTRQKIFRDRTYNHLQLLGESSAIRMPIFPDQSLSASSNFAAPATLYLGSSVFELADTLSLLPHQANSQLLPYENVQLQHLVVDSNSYYSKISQRGLVRLICDHFLRPRHLCLLLPVLGPSKHVYTYQAVQAIVHADM